MTTDLSAAIKVDFARMFLDPNNPRLGRERVGYDDADAIFPETVQLELEKKMVETYDISDLEEKIIGQGWVPIDAILVWEHPKRKGQYVVVEGNSRTTALRNIRRRYEREKQQYDNKLKKKGTDKDILEEMRRKLECCEQVITETNTLQVLPVAAKNSAELLEKLPRLLGVRHISHAQQWGPYATNLFITSLYRKAYSQKHPDKKLEIDRDLVQEVGQGVSLAERKARRFIQTATAFERFRQRWEDQLPEGEKISDEDHYFFDLILQNRHAQVQFGFEQDVLELPPEKEKVLFEWAFSKPRGKGDNNPNILRIAEDIRLWNRIKKYDDDHGTHFASQLNVDEPEKATPMSKVEAEYLAHKARQSPTDLLQDLVDAFRDLKADTLRSQALHVEPLIQEIVKLGNDFLKMLNAVATAKK